jgi:DNA-binding response OmpR family regulator
MSAERTILLADRDAALRRSTAGLLKTTGYGVAAATDYEGAFDIAEHEDLSLAVIAIELKGESTGFVLLRALQALRPTLPVIVLVETPESEDVLAAFRLGAADVLVKPIDTFELLCIVDRELITSQDRGS